MFRQAVAKGVQRASHRLAQVRGAGATRIVAVPIQEPLAGIQEEINATGEAESDDGSDGSASDE